MSIDRITHLAEAKNDITLADLVADETNSEPAIRTRLNEVESRMQGKAPVLVVIRATPLSLKLAKEWTESLVSRKVQLAPVSAVAIKK